MSRVDVRLRYDGPALSSHQMDVRDLAPALMAFGNLCREANRVLNGERASVRVYVNADIEAKCVQVALTVAWTWLEQAKALFESEPVKTARDVIELLGFGFTAAAYSRSLLQYLLTVGSERMGNINSGTTISDIQGKDVVALAMPVHYHINGDHAVIFPPDVLRLANDPKVVANIKSLVKPVAQQDGITEVGLRAEGAEENVVDKPMAEAILMAPSADEDDAPPQYITTHIEVHRPVVGDRAKTWQFKLNGHVEDIDISEPDIAKRLQRRRKVVWGDTYKVKLEVRERRGDRGYKHFYKVIEVVDFIPGVEQIDLPIGGDNVEP